MKIFYVKDGIGEVMDCHDVEVCEDGFVVDGKTIIRLEDTICISDK